MEIGRLCAKTAGRDAGQLCIVVDVLDKTYVMIDGNTRRKKCNIAHLHTLKQKFDIKKGASHSDVIKAFQKNNIEVLERKPAKAGYTAQPSLKKAEKAKKAEEKKAAKEAKKKEKKAKKPVKKEPAKKKTKKTTKKAPAKKTPAGAPERSEKAAAKKTKAKK
jgi:large subunit ribosomal protein L14e